MRFLEFLSKKTSKYKHYRKQLEFIDGLEKTVEILGVEETDSTYTGLMADYSVNGVEDSFASTAIAGVVGFAVVLGLGVILGNSLNKSNKTPKKQQNNTNCLTLICLIISQLALKGVCLFFMW